MNKHGRHSAAGCREGDLCTGIGCRVSTGKTRRKMNFKRPKPNQHEGTRVRVAEPVQKKGKR